MREPIYSTTSTPQSLDDVVGMTPEAPLGQETQPLIWHSSVTKTEAEPGTDPPAKRPLPREDAATVAIKRLSRLVAILAVGLLVVHFTPMAVEEIQFAITKGRHRAEYTMASRALANSSLSELSQACQLISNRVGPSVVHINTSSDLALGNFNNLKSRVPRPNPHPSRGQGSGVIVDDKGHILTNRHVIFGSEKIRVKLADGRAVQARVVGVDELTDLALLKVDAGELIPVHWGDSDKLETGALVWALGSPFGLEQSMTFGILSAKHRSTHVGRHHQDFLQTDVAVNPGNSGGPLVNAQGNLIGINTAIVGESYQGVSFAIPSQVARQVYERLKDGGHVRRGWMGVALEDVAESDVDALGLPRRMGAMVAGYATSSSPAKDAGIQIGDVIISFNDVTVDDMAKLIRLISKAPIGSTAIVVVMRQGETIRLQMKIGERPPHFG